MKQILKIILILGVVGIIIYFGENYLTNKAIQNILHQVQIEKSNQILESIKENILSPEPLVKIDKEKKSILTPDGIFYWTNYYRNQNGVKNISKSSLLDKVAFLRAQDMFEKQYFAHYSPTGIGAPQFMEEIGYDYVLVGENIALGHFDGDKSLVEAWMNSPPHRENILNNRFTEIGISAIEGNYKDEKMEKSEKLWIAVQVFAKPVGSCQKPNPNLRLQIESLQREVDELKSQANIMWEYISTHNVVYSKEEAIAIAKKIEEYNNLVILVNKKIAELKNLIYKYNLEVDAFNKCVEL